MEIQKNIIANIEGFIDKNKSQEYTQVRIPYYQRPYKWEPENINILFNDFFSATARSTGHYFIGSVIACDDSDAQHPEIAVYEIVDGQQRLTTVFLLNYLRFLLARSYIEDLLLAGISGPLMHNYEALKSHYKMFLGVKHTSDANITQLENFKTELDKEVLKASGIDSAMLLKDFRVAVGLSTKDPSDDTFCMDYERQLSNFLKKEELALFYSRETLNTKLKDALSKVRFSSVDRDLYPDDEEMPDDTVEQKYIEILKSLYRNVRMRVNLDGGSSLDDLQYTQKSIEVIDYMLEELQICLLTCGDPNDAYTLFEVLNDRGYEISDLELMKNLVLKEYCSTSTDSDKDIRIEELDDLWENVFDSNLAKGERDLISYLGTIFLSGDKTTTPLNIKTQYRHLIREKRYPEGHDPYNYFEAYNDVAVFSMCKMILEKAKMKYTATFGASFDAEKSGNSVIYTSINLLHALKCDGVLPVIVNLLLNDYKAQRNIDLKTNRIDLADFEKYVVNSFEDKVAVGEIKANQQVYAICDALEKAVLLSKDYTKPREYAAKIIGICWRNNYKVDKILQEIDLSAIETEFESWIMGWSYGKNKHQQHRIAIILMRLYMYYNLEEDNGIRKLSRFSGTGQRFDNNAIMTLDHLEPKEIDSKKPGDYYSESDLETRKNVVNSVGNMMILNSYNNSRKNNDPLESGLTNTYSKMAPSFLIEDIKNELNSNYSPGVTVSKVPDDAFFASRKDRLLQYFKKFLFSTYNQSQINL